MASVPINQNRVYLRTDMDFTDHTDKATFFYSLDSLNWTAIGNTLQMNYDLTHFVGYRFALFNYATKSAGGYTDFDWFKIGSSYNESVELPESGFSLSVQTIGQGTVSRTPTSTVYRLSP